MKLIMKIKNGKVHFVRKTFHYPIFHTWTFRDVETRSIHRCYDKFSAFRSFICHTMKAFMLTCVSLEYVLRTENRVRVCITTLLLDFCLFHSVYNKASLFKLFYSKTFVLNNTNKYIFFKKNISYLNMGT